MSFITKAYIYSLNKDNIQSTEMDDITVLEQTMVSGNQPGYIVDYKGIKCYAIFNPFACAYYVDDIYGRVN